VRQDNKGVRRATWRVPANVGLVSKALIAANVIVYVLQQSDRTFTNRYAMQPAAVAAGDYYRLLTGAFLHAGLLHIGFNMFALYIFGVQVEAVLGRVRYLALYLLAAVGGSVCSLLLAPPLQASVGASGAIFG